MADLVTWMVKAKRGESMQYARGNLASMREESRVLYVEKKPIPPQTEIMLDNARTAWHAYEKGMVTLVQRRMGWDDFSYIAQKV